MIFLINFILIVVSLKFDIIHNYIIIMGYTWIASNTKTYHSKINVFIP